MTLETDRLILRPWEESDAEALYEYAKDPLVGPAAGWQPHMSVKNSLEIIKTVLSAPDTFAVCLKPDNTPIGSVGLFEPRSRGVKNRERETEIGYWIGVPFWGQGLIPEAVKRMQLYAFDFLGKTVMWCGYYDGNEKSKRAQEKCGFRYHHTEKNIYLPAFDEYRTEHFTRITGTEWKNENKKDR